MDSTGAMRGPKTSFERVLLAHLQRGVTERYTLPKSARAGLTRTLGHAVDGPNAMEEIRRALQLITAFDRELASPSVSAALVDLLRANPRAKELTRAFGGPRAIDKARAFRRREGRETGSSAPRIGERAPKSSMTVSQLKPERSVGAPPGVTRELRVRRT